MKEKITAKVITNPESKAFGRLGFNKVDAFFTLDEKLIQNAKISERLDKEIFTIVSYIARNHKSYTQEDNKYFGRRKPKTFLKLELLLKIKYGKRIEVEYP